MIPNYPLSDFCVFFWKYTLLPVGGYESCSRNTQIGFWAWAFFSGFQPVTLEGGHRSNHTISWLQTHFWNLPNADSGGTISAVKRSFSPKLMTGTMDAPVSAARRTNPCLRLTMMSIVPGVTCRDSSAPPTASAIDRPVPLQFKEVQPRSILQTLICKFASFCYLVRPMYRFKYQPHRKRWYSSVKVDTCSYWRVQGEHNIVSRLPIMGSSVAIMVGTEYQLQWISR